MGEGEHMLHGGWYFITAEDGTVIARFCECGAELPSPEIIQIDEVELR